MSEEASQTYYIDCFIESNYDKNIRGSIVGCKIGHLPLETYFIENLKSKEATIHAIHKCIEKCNEKYPGAVINLHTDLHDATNIVCDSNVRMFYLGNQIVKENESIHQSHNQLITRKQINHLQQKYEETKGASSKP
jgi:methyl coenzyme M reductase alpha subunit